MSKLFKGFTIIATWTTGVRVLQFKNRWYRASANFTHFQGKLAWSRVLMNSGTATVEQTAPGALITKVQYL